MSVETVWGPRLGVDAVSVARRRGGLAWDGPVVLVVIVVCAVTLSSTGYYVVAGPIAAVILTVHFYRQVRLNRALRAALSERFGFQVQATPSLLRTAYFDAWCRKNGIDPRWSETVGVPDARRAVVFRRLGDYLVCSYSQMSTGVRRMNGELARLKKLASDEDLGQAVDRALDASVVGIAVPPATSPSPLEPLREEARGCRVVPVVACPDGRGLAPGDALGQNAAGR
jgi:hypothetical protein